MKFKEHVWPSQSCLGSVQVKAMHMQTSRLRGLVAYDNRQRLHRGRLSTARCTPRRCRAAARRSRLSSGRRHRLACAASALWRSCSPCNPPRPFWCTGGCTRLCGRIAGCRRSRLRPCSNDLLVRAKTANDKGAFLWACNDFADTRQMDHYVQSCTIQALHGLRATTMPHASTCTSELPSSCRPDCRVNSWFTPGRLSVGSYRAVLTSCNAWAVGACLRRLRRPHTPDRERGC